MQSHRIPYSKVPVAKLNRLTRKTHQGVVAYLAPITFATLDEVVQSCYDRGRDPFILILDGITDARNFGAIVRTAVCTGVDAIVVPTHGSVAIREDAVKTSAGALMHASICRVDNLQETLAMLQQNGLQIVACEAKGQDSLHHFTFEGPMALLLGAEDTGIAPRHLQAADKSIHIPMTGPIGSLNVSVAAAVVLYERVRQCDLCV